MKFANLKFARNFNSSCLTRSHMQIRYLTCLQLVSLCNKGEILSLKTRCSGCSLGHKNLFIQGTEFWNKLGSEAKQRVASLLLRKVMR